MKPLVVAATFVLAVLLIGRAIDQEHATAAGGLTERGASLTGDRAAAPVARVAMTHGSDRERPRSVSPSGGIGTAATYRDGLTKEFGDGLIRVNRLGPEAWRWALVKERRRADDLQRRLTRRVLQVRTLRRVVGRSFIPSYWVAIASCESGVSWGYNGSSGFDGAIQFAPSTWSANRLNGYPAYAYQATPFQQLVVGEIVLSRGGWGQWPACSRKAGLR